jgi:hypothetical protein
MEIIERKRIKDSVIIAKTKLLQLTNNVSNLVSILGLSTILLPIPENVKYVFYLFIIFCLLYSSINGNQIASKIIEERKNKGDLFSINNMDPNILVKMTNIEYKQVKNTLEK